MCEYGVCPEGTGPREERHTHKCTHTHTPSFCKILLPASCRVSRAWQPRVRAPISVDCKPSHTHAYTRTHTRTHARTHVHTHAYTRTHTRTHTHTHTHTHNTRTRRRTHAHAHVHAYTAYAHTYSRTTTRSTHHTSHPRSRPRSHIIARTHRHVHTLTHPALTRNTSQLSLGSSPLRTRSSCSMCATRT